MFNTIIKRDGRTAAYDVEKIARAIFRAATSVGGKDYQTAYRLALQVQQRLEEKYPPSHLPTVEQIQDMVENQIMKPKAEYFDELVDRNLLTGIRETAGELGVKQNQFVAFLLEKKYMYRDKKGKLTAYAKPLSDGLFERKECMNEKTQWKGTQDLVTPKGRETFRLLMVGA